MAVEAKRGCGYRKVGGLYLVSGKLSASCCKLPAPLTVCPCCGQGIKQTRGWTWVDPSKLLAGECKIEDLSILGGARICPCANPATSMGTRAGLIWIGRAFYPKPEDFQREGAALGVSRRINSIPRGFEVGKTWVLFAHLDTIKEQYTVESAARDPLLFGEGATTWSVKVRGEVVRDKDGNPEVFESEQLALHRAGVLDQTKPVFTPGIFQVFRPERVERIVKQSEFDAAKDENSKRAEAAYIEPGVDGPKWEPSEVLARFDLDSKRGIVWVPVPDDDKDHQGTAYDREEDPDAV